MHEITKKIYKGVTLTSYEDGGVSVYEVAIPDGSSFCYTERELRALFQLGKYFDSTVNETEKYIAENVLGV